MARPKTITYTGVSAAACPWIPLDWRQSFFGVRYSVVKAGTGDVTYSVQGTVDDVLRGVTVTNIIDEVSAKTVSFQSTIVNAPYTAMRLNITAVSGVASLSFGILQSDAGGG